VEKESSVVHEEVPKEEATVKTARALKTWDGDQHLAVGCRHQLKKQTQGDGGSRQKLTASCRGIPCLVIPLHGARDQEGTMMQEEPRKDGQSGRHVGSNWNATMA
jgi:hypothetical protein